jgi:hypothetical protein
MFVKIGFNTDYGKYKFDVGLDETDLGRILEEAGIPPDSQLTVVEAFRILAEAADRFCAVQKMTTDPALAERHKRAARESGERMAARLAEVRTRLGMDSEPAGD